MTGHWSTLSCMHPFAFVATRLKRYIHPCLVYIYIYIIIYIQKNICANLQNMYLFQSLMPVKWLSTLAVLHKFASVKNYVKLKWGDCFNCRYSFTSNVKYVSLSKYDFYSYQLWLLYIVSICCNSTKMKSVICAKIKSDICAKQHFRPRGLENHMGPYKHRPL